jgi:hypothetical protein
MQEEETPQSRTIPKSAGFKRSFDVAFLAGSSKNPGEKSAFTKYSSSNLNKETAPTAAETGQNASYETRHGENESSSSRMQQSGLAISSSTSGLNTMMQFPALRKLLDITGKSKWIELHDWISLEINEKIG